jgi:hypothetical protein
MLRKCTDDLKYTDFPQLRRQFPALQERVYKVLLELSPQRLIFEMAQLPKNLQGIALCGIDQETFATIGQVLQHVLNEKQLVLTEHDVLVAYQRFQELIFKFHAVRQAVMVEQVTDEGIDYYFNVADPTPSDQVRRYRSRNEYGVR